MRDSEYIPKKQTILAISLLLLTVAFGIAKAHGENTGNSTDIEQIQQLQKRYVCDFTLTVRLVGAFKALEHGGQRRL